MYHFKCLGWSKSNSSSSTVACGSFKKLENRFAYDGIEQTRATTLAECKKMCLDKDTCLGFDFNIRSRCYLHFDPTAFNEVYEASHKDVDHYIREPCTTTAAPTTAGQCDDHEMVLCSRPWYACLTNPVSN